MSGLARLQAALGGWLHDQRGAAAPIVAFALTCLIALAGYAIDMGRVLWVQRQLQASADAAALAGAAFVVTDPAAAKSTAVSFSGLSGMKNAVRGAGSVQLVGGEPTLKCLTSFSFPPCSAGAGTYNGIVVSQQAVVPTYFLRILGFKTLSPVATATALAKGGAGKPLDVMVVLDTTGSMLELDPSCAIPNATKIQCAQAGAYTLVKGLNPALGDKIGFMVFPGLTAAGVTADTTCGGVLNTTHLAPYGANPIYAVVNLTNPFQPNGKIDTTAKPAIAVGAGGVGCKGIQVAGLHTAGTYFADAITAAANALAADNSPNSQKVIVLLSDGDAAAPIIYGTPPNTFADMSPAKYPNQCQQAIANARTAAAAGYWVYAVAYGAEMTGAFATPAGCAADTSNYPGVNMRGVSPCATMQAIASDASKFYADGFGGSGCVGTGGNSNDLVALFKSISTDLTQPRLLPNNTV
jgi:Flp pilus assembly protein TadG